ncbi:MAG: hypothetical protein WAZ14_01405 [Patescibacteria group bacterium]
MLKFFKGLVVYFSLGLAIFLPSLVNAAMSSTNYRIQFDSVGVGGLDNPSSASYGLRDTLEFIQGIGTSASYRVDEGYRGGIYDPIVHFTVIAQDTASQVAATAITSTSVSVTLATGYVTGDYIAVIQNEGLSQIAAIGRITSVAGATLNIDFFTDGGTFPVIDSVNDYVYELTDTGIPLSSLTPSTAQTGILAWDVDASVPEGYSVYVFEDHDLWVSSGTAINDVEDGAVTTSNEEYGGRSSDTTLSGSTFDTADTSFTTSLQQVASRNVSTLKSRDFLTLKVAAAETTVDGAYSHTLTVVFVGDY